MCKKDTGLSLHRRRTLAISTGPLTPKEKKQLEDQIAVWVCRKKRPVTADEIARYFDLHIHTARLLVHAIMRRTDGTLCRLEGRYVRNPVSKRTRQVKYFSVLSLPDSLSHSRNEQDGRE
ncbi:hypothetical protein [Citrobacter braakii]|uniref:DNA-binding protein n=1 Tax=Citrobacter braakii TaxID=57706 RepID=A0A1V8NT96_CITBR|nr:hypothetical protein [Citrobacter braakii]EBW7151988.1 hypothetical protein [Salmonella enterica subsp. enterica serovar Coeln]OQM39631.1 hypothetical protein BZK42_23685 [Citrobacter braakii]QXC16677.1 hypothetical protein I6L51_00675 [Citrobacter braakii]